MICPNCGKENDNDKFCYNCGTELDGVKVSKRSGIIIAIGSIISAIVLIVIIVIISMAKGCTNDKVKVKTDSSSNSDTDIQTTTSEVTTTELTKALTETEKDTTTTTTVTTTTTTTTTKATTTTKEKVETEKDITYDKYQIDDYTMAIVLHNNTDKCLDVGGSCELYTVNGLEAKDVGWIFFGEEAILPHYDRIVILENYDPFTGCFITFNTEESSDRMRGIALNTEVTYTQYTDGGIDLYFNYNIYDGQEYAGAGGVILYFDYNGNCMGYYQFSAGFHTGETTTQYIEPKHSGYSKVMITYGTNF